MRLRPAPCTSRIVSVNSIDPIALLDPHQVLIVLPTWVGDFVMATPFLRATRERFAAARIIFLVEPNLADLVRGGDWMNECVQWPAVGRRMPWHREFRALAADLRGRSVDLAILLPNSARAALIAFLARAGRRVGYARDGRRFLLTDPVPVRNRTMASPATDGNQAAAFSNLGITPYGAENPPAPRGPFQPVPLVEYYADLAEILGCPRPGDRLELFTTPDCTDSLARKLATRGADAKRPLVVISPGAKYGAAKCWLPERFAEVADRLADECGASVVITCGPGETDIARAIAGAMKANAVAFDDPVLTLGELKSLVARADLLICNDTGPRHLAKAFDVPVVTIFGPTHPRWTATGHRNERIVRIDVDCGPCQQRTCPRGHLKCMTGVSTGMVFDCAAELLEQRKPTANPR